MSFQFSVLSVLFILVLAASVPASRDFTPGSDAPDFVLQDVSGKEFPLVAMKGKIVIIVFWRAGQKRSISALTNLQSIYANYSEQDVIVYAISPRIGQEVISAAKQSMNLTFPMLCDDEGKVYGDYGVMIAPSTFIIDKSGKFSFHYPGYRDDYARQISGRIDVLLGKKTLEQLLTELQPAQRPKISDSEKKARRYMNAGDRFLEKGMTRSAMVEYQKAVQEMPDLFEAHLRLGDIYVKEKKIQEAEVAFRQAIKLKPRSADANAGLGDVLFFQKHLDDSIEILQLALKLNPNLAKAHYRLGTIYQEQKRLDDALKEYRIALKILLNVEE